MEVVREMASVGAVLLLLAVTLWFLRRAGWTSSRVGKCRERRLESLERLSLSPQFTLHLVRLDGTTLLLASTASGCTVVDRRPGEAAQ